MGEKVPDDFAIREAMQVVRDPRKRLVAEFFWFHIDSLDRPSSTNPQALALLRSGDWQRARQLWKSEWQESPESDRGRRALHNLAVFLHARVVTREAGRNPLVKSLKQNAPLAPDHIQDWKDALSAWSHYFSDAAAWRHWRTRAKELGDKRSGEEFADELREILPETLLQINRDLARQYAGAGLGFAAGQHCQLIQKSGFAPETATLFCRTVVDGVKKRLLSESEAFQSRLKSSDIVEESQKFDGIVRRDLALLVQIDPQRAYGSGAARESVARSFHSAGLRLSSARDWMGSLTLIGKALQLSDSATLRADIEDSQSKIQYWRSIWLKAPRTCICCGRAPAEWTTFTQSPSRQERLIFYCATHADPSAEWQVKEAVGRLWNSLPTPPPEPRR